MLIHLYIDIEKIKSTIILRKSRSFTQNNLSEWSSNNFGSPTTSPLTNYDDHPFFIL